ncbi:MAG: HIT family protein [Thermomicrobiales bacterium]
MSQETGHERLWTPWRMRYIAGQAKEEGCIFCNRLHGDDDVASLILHRGQHCFVIVNLFPYNTGHVMIVPRQHADDLDQLDATTMHEMADVLPVATSALKRVLNCQGFNVGLNIGSVAGAGVAEHLHQHVVPRWVGDANFMPIIASTTVMPELIPTSYAKIRAELHREFTGDTNCKLLILLDDDSTIAFVNGALPICSATPQESIWQAAMSMVRNWAAEIEIAGWAGQNRATRDTPSGLMIRARLENRDRLPALMQLVRLDRGGEQEVSRPDGAFIKEALGNLAPRTAPPVTGDQTVS